MLYRWTSRVSPPNFSFFRFCSGLRSKFRHVSYTILETSSPRSKSPRSWETKRICKVEVPGKRSRICSVLRSGRSLYVLRKICPRASAHLLRHCLQGGPFWYSCRGAHNLKLRHWAELPLVNEACIAVKLYDMMDIFVVTSISSFHYSSFINL